MHLRPHQTSVVNYMPSSGVVYGSASQPPLSAPPTFYDQRDRLPPSSADPYRSHAAMQPIQYTSDGSSYYAAPSAQPYYGPPPTSRPMGGYGDPSGYAAPQIAAAAQHRHSVDTAMLPSGSHVAGGSGHLLDLDVWDQIKSKVDQQPAEWSRHDDLETARIAADLKRFAETEMNRNPATFAELKRPVELAEADSTFVEDADAMGR